MLNTVGFDLPNNGSNGFIGWHLIGTEVTNQVTLGRALPASFDSFTRTAPI